MNIHMYTLHLRVASSVEDEIARPLHGHVSKSSCPAQRP